MNYKYNIHNNYHRKKHINRHIIIDQTVKIVCKRTTMKQMA